MDRPIGFTMDDYEEYERTRGFFFENFKEYMPGHHMYSYDDLTSFICDLVDERDPYEDKRQEVLPVFWKYADGHNCERLAQSIGIFL